MHTTTLIKDKLAVFAPTWCSVKISAYVEFLGFQWGPGADEDIIWEATLAKFRVRMLTIKLSGECPSLSLALARARATSVLCYLT